MVSVQIYVEGGGSSKALKTACRRGFRKFIENAGLTGPMPPKVVACGSRGNAYQSFQKAHTSGNVDAMLLVDAEGPVTAAGSWQHLKTSDNWNRPNGTTDDQCHLMVQVMESWFLADADVLASFYGQNFRSQDLMANPDIERVSKQDALGRLAQATRNTKKGSYKKGADSYQILEKLDPDKVRKASAHADRFIRALSAPIP